MQRCWWYTQNICLKPGYWRFAHTTCHFTSCATSGGLALNLCSVELLLHFHFVDVPAFLGYLTTILSYLFLISFMFNDAVKCNAASDTPRTYASNQGTEGLLTLPGISLVVLLLWGLALHLRSVEPLLHFHFVDVPAFLGYLTFYRLYLTTILS
jgi:hypothetical protein